MDVLEPFEHLYKLPEICPPMYSGKQTLLSTSYSREILPKESDLIPDHTTIINTMVKVGTEYSLCDGRSGWLEMSIFKYFQFTSPLIILQVFGEILQRPRPWYL